MSKMVKIRGVRYSALSSAGVAYEGVVTGALRDILPDQAFKIHHVITSIRISGADTTAEIQFLKNVGAPPGPLAAQDPRVDHGLMLEYFGWKEGSYITDSDFEEPMDFDKDDSLNIRFHVDAQPGALAVLETCVLFSVGK